MERKLIETYLPLKRRQILQWCLLGGGALGIAAILKNFAVSGGKANAVKIPPTAPDLPSFGSSVSPMAHLRKFDDGTLRTENGKTIREFEAVAHSTTLQLNSATPFVSWNLNGQVPGPTFRAKAGDRVRIIFHNQDGHSHSLHFHGMHPTGMDGLKPVRHGKTTVYEFDAEPYGVHLYHCHIAPVSRHIEKGLYGMFIIDPPQERPPADEMVLIMGGYDLDEDQQNELYAFNGIPNYFRDYPIAIAQNQLVRLYVLNMIEFDAPLSFHIHANFFQVYRTGRTLIPSEEADVITMGTAERHILEFRYADPGHYMFHPHQDEIAEHGCMGMFNVVPSQSA